MDSMKQLYLLFTFCFFSTGAMVRTDRSEPSILALERTDTIEIDYGALPPKKAKMGTEDKDVHETQWKAWIKCAKKFDVMGLHIMGFLTFVNKDLMQGTAVGQDVKQLHRIQDKSTDQARALRARLAACYKIHLMPFDDYIVPIISKLLERVNRDIRLQQAMSHFKVYSFPDLIAQKDGDKHIPIFVIYCHANKDAAQYVLDVVYALFKNMPGRDITPRYNQKITSLIYYAQGDGDYKSEQYHDCYEPGCIHYRADFEGEHKDYHLKNPAGDI